MLLPPTLNIPAVRHRGFQPMASAALTAGKVSGGGSSSSFWRSKYSVPSGPTELHHGASDAHQFPNCAPLQVSHAEFISRTHARRCGGGDVTFLKEQSLIFIFSPFFFIFIFLFLMRQHKSLNRLWQFFSPHFPAPILNEV